MQKESKTASRLRSLFRRPAPLHPWEQVLADERAANLALLRQRQQAQRHAEQMQNLVSFWPVGLGVLLGCMAPIFAALAQDFGPWGMTVAFPFAVLAQRPEVQIGGFAHLLPTIMLYGQFPLEGWLARIVLQRRVRAFSVAGHILLFHFLGVAQLLLLSGVFYTLVSHVGVSLPR